MTTVDRDVLVVGAGVAGLTAGLFTARADLDTELVNSGSSILNRNAHLENYPGFPRGINPRLLLEMMEEQARNAGCSFTRRAVLDVEDADPFRVNLQGVRRTARRIILASWSDCSYVQDLESYQEGSKTFLATDEEGETSRPGIYAAGRITGVRHQTVVAAGDGADVGLSVVEDLRPEYYRDWVAPEGYFSGRGRELPEGCEEISEEERKRRARRAREELLRFMEEPPDEGPTQHPSVEN